MTPTGLGRHTSKPILEWDEVDMDDDSQGAEQHASASARAGLVASLATPRTEDEGKGGSPWNAVRKLFKR